MSANLDGDDVERGMDKISWARAHMEILEGVRKRFEKKRPFKGMRLSLVLHVEAKTAALALALKAGGADVTLAASNPLTTDDQVVSGLRSQGIVTYAKKGESLEEYARGIKESLDASPEIIIDDGADLVVAAVKKRMKVIGSTEETTTGVVRLKAMERDRSLPWPAIDVNDATMKHLFDNRYGTGQSTLDGIFSATNLSIAGRTAVVAGYGWCGKGVSSRLRGLGADVIVTEVDPAKAVEARLEGFRVMKMIDAVREADFIVTVTGCKDVVTREHFEVMKDGCVMANSGHFDVEVNAVELKKMATSHRKARPSVEEFELKDGRKVYLLAEGRLVNLSAGQGHPVEIMDMSFALQALSAEFLINRGRSLSPGVHPVPTELDQAVARAALSVYGAGLDALTDGQKRYLESWQGGT